MSDTKDSGYQPSDEAKDLVLKHLGANAYFEKGYNKSVLLKKSEAEKRKALITEVEYDFQVAINHGSHYMGKAVVNFYAKEKPTAGDLFLDFKAMAVGQLTVNDEVKNAAELFAN
jgi:hypothetical protein